MHPLLLIILSTVSSVLAERSSRGLGDFKTPGIDARPKFRYWLPDASVPVESVQRDIADFAAVGSAGLEFLPFYFYGLPSTGVAPPTDWNRYGFGTLAFNELFKGALKATKEAGTIMDFPFGANQGQGVPTEPGTEGLAKQLILGNATVAAGDNFSGELVPGELNKQLVSGLGFQHPLEHFGNRTLKVALAAQVETVSNGTIPQVKLNESSIVDLTDIVKYNQLNWTAPGYGDTWRIIAVWETFTNQKSCSGAPNATNIIGNGSWIVDHFSQDGAVLMTRFFDQVVLADNETRALVTDVGKYGWEDSLEAVAAIFWSSGLLSRFEKLYNYSLNLYLPLLFEARNGWGGALPQYPETFAYGKYTPDGQSVHSVNYLRALNDGYHDYLETLTRYCQSIGIEYSSQVGSSIPSDSLSNVPMVDCPETESLGANDNIDIYRQFSGPAHLMGKRVISSELGATNTPAYNMTVPALLSRIKKSFAGGLNMMVIHGAQYTGEYPLTTWPGVSAFYYRITELWGRRLPSWQHLSDVVDYIARNQVVLQQGQPQVDLAFYLNEIPSILSTSYQSTNFLKQGYTYDYLDASNMLSSSAVVEGRMLAPAGPAYKALVFSNSTQSDVSLATRVKEFALAGLPVFLVGPAHNQQIDNSSGASLTAEFGSYFADVENVITVADADSLPNALSSRGIGPRCSLKDEKEAWYVARRRDAAKNTDYIYMYNDGGSTESTTVSFEASPSAVPYVLDAWRGTETPVVEYSRARSGIAMPIALGSLESTIIALKNIATGDEPIVEDPIVQSNNVIGLTFTESGVVAIRRYGPASIKTASGKHLSFEGSAPASVSLQTWNLTLEDWHGPTNSNTSNVETEVSTHRFQSMALKAWKDLADGFDAVSGVGHYETAFVAPVCEKSNSSEGMGAVLSLGPIFDTVRVWVNGEQVPPVDPVKPSVDITGAIHWGSSNSLRVDVTSTLFNQIKAQANQSLTAGYPASFTNPQYSSSEFLPYGLLGPVNIAWALVNQLT